MTTGYSFVFCFLFFTLICHLLIFQSKLDMFWFWILSLKTRNFHKFSVNLDFFFPVTSASITKLIAKMKPSRGFSYTGPLCGCFDNLALLQESYCSIPAKKEKKKNGTSPCPKIIVDHFPICFSYQRS